MPNGKPNFYDLYNKVGNIEGKLDTALKVLENHDIRINKVEKVQDTMVGKITVISAIFGIIGAGVITAIGWFIKK